MTVFSVTSNVQSTPSNFRRKFSRLIRRCSRNSAAPSADSAAPPDSARRRATPDGLMIEVHNDPDSALCDGAQSLKPEKFDALMKQICQIATVVGKQI